MTIKFLNVYNNLVSLTTNKKLYISLRSQDTFSDRLTIFLTHFAFFLKVYKTEQNKKILQEIYDFNFRQMELSIREIGYGDQSINKKMKDYINVFHAILSDIHFWDTMNNEDKINKLSKFFNNYEKIDHLIEYFNDFNNILSKKTLNSFLKSVSNS